MLSSMPLKMLEYFRLHDLAGKRITEVGERAFGRGWMDDLRKGLGLKSTAQLGSWIHARRAPPDYQDQLIAAIRKVRDEEFAATQATAQARYIALTELLVEMETNRLPEPRLPAGTPKAA